MTLSEILWVVCTSSEEDEGEDGSLRASNKELKDKATSHKMDLEALKKKVNASSASVRVRTYWNHSSVFWVVHACSTI
jgi:hypothetical protein